MKCVAVFFSVVCSLVCLISAPRELVCKSYLEKMGVNCHENLEEFQIRQNCKRGGCSIQFACWDGNYAFFVEIG